MSIIRSRLFAASALTLGLGIAVQSANAVPFDAIVPTVYHIDTQNNTIGVGSQFSGYIAATTDTLNQTDLDNIVFTAVETDPLVDVSHSGPVNTHILTTINPGELIGRSFAGLTDPMDALVLPGETHLSPSIGYLGINANHPVHHVGTVTVQATISSGADFVNFTYDIVFGVFPDTIKVVSAQRLSSVPEPGTALLAGAGLAALGLRRKR